MKKLCCVLLSLMLLLSAAGAENADSTRPMEGLNTVDIYGNKVDASLLEGYDLVVVNLWATFCGYCIMEMPSLGKLAKEWKDKGVLIVGMCCDVGTSSRKSDSKQLLTARQIVETTQADYPHLLPDQGREAFINANIMGYPATFFLDGDGNMIGDIIFGMREYDDWNELIREMLESVSPKTEAA